MAWSTPPCRSLLETLPETVQSTLLLCAVPSADALPGVLRWQSRLWQLVTKLRGARDLGGPSPNPALLDRKQQAESRKIWENLNYAVQEVDNPS